MRSGRALKKTLPPPGPPDLPGRNGLLDVSAPAPHLGAARRHADPRCPATAPRKVSAIGALVVSPHRRRVNLYLALHPKQNIRGPHVLRFLRHLRRHLPGPWLLWWDRGKPHRHQQGREYLQRHPQWQVEWLPPYAPELNPQEQVWTYLKLGCLSNFAPDDVEDLSRQVRQHARRAARRPQLLKNLFRNSQLPFLIPD